MRQIFGNIEDLKDYHSGVILPRLQGSMSNEELIKLVKIVDSTSSTCFLLILFFQGALLV